MFCFVCACSQSLDNTATLKLFSSEKRHSFPWIRSCAKFTSSRAKLGTRASSCPSLPYNNSISQTTNPSYVCMYVCVFMAFITTLDLCARSQDLLLSVSVRRVLVVFSPLRDLGAEDSRVPRHVKPPRCGVAELYSKREGEYVRQICAT